MKRTSFFPKLITKEFTREKGKYISIITLFLLGMTLGSLLSSLSGSLSQIQNYVDTFLSSYSLQGTVKQQVFFISLFNYGKFAFFLWISGWHTWLFPLCFLQVLSKGFRIGYTIACFVQCYHFRGIIFSLLTLLPQNLLFLPALFYFSVYQFHFLAERKLILTGKSSSSTQKETYGKNAIFLFFFLFLLFLCALIEGYLVPTMLQPLCKFMM